MAYIPGSLSSKTKAGRYIPGSLSNRGASDPFFTTSPFQEAVQETKPSFWDKAKADIIGTSPSGVGAAIGQQVAGTLGGWGETYEWLGTKYDWKGVEQAKSFSEKMDVWKQGNTREDQTTIEKYIGGGAGMGLYYVPGLGSMSAANFVLKNSPKLAKLAGGSTMALLESGSEAGSVYGELKEMGRSEAEADSKAGKVFWTNIVLGTITNRLGIFGDSEKILKKMASSAISEGVQEYGQAVISNVATDRKWDEGALEAGKMGFVLGGVFGSVNITTDTKGVVKENIEKKLNISPEKATKFVNEIQTLQKEEKKPAVFRDIKEGTSKNILNLLYKEPTTKVEDIITKPSDRAAQILRGEIKIEPVKKEIAKPVIEKVDVDRVKRVIEAERKQIKESIRTEDQKQAEYKRIGMEMSAINRQLERKPTMREVEVATKKLESIHTGKEVDYLGQKVIATGKVSFGKHEVKLKDGTTKYVPRADIKTEKITRGDAMKYLQEQAEIKLKGREETFGLKPIKPVKKKEVKKDVIKKPTEREKALDLSKEEKRKKIVKEYEKDKPTHKISEYSKGVEATAIKNEMTKRFEGLPEHEVRNMIEQTQKATAIMNEDYDRAIRIVFENEIPPSGTNIVAFANALELKARKDGDVEMLRRLSTSTVLAGQITEAAQIIRTVGERYKESPIDAMKDVIAAREDAFKGDIKSGKTKVANEIKKEIKKATSTKEDWSSFINKLKC